MFLFRPHSQETLLAIDLGDPVFYTVFAKLFQPFWAICLFCLIVYNFIHSVYFNDSSPITMFQRIIYDKITLYIRPIQYMLFKNCILSSTEQSMGRDLSANSLSSHKAFLINYLSSFSIQSCVWRQRQCGFVCVCARMCT